MKRYLLPIVAGLFTAALLCVAPPQWVSYWDTSEQFHRSVGHYFIWSPPREEDSESVGRGWSTGIYQTQFRLELAAVALASIGGAVLIRFLDQRPPRT